MISKLKESKKAAALFEGWQETLIWSCLQNIMGSIYADFQETPASAMALQGDFCFLAGAPSKELILYEPVQRSQAFAIMIPQSEEWGALIENCYGENAKKVSRYAFKKELDVFDQDKLRKIVDGLPDGYTLQMLDETLFWHCKGIPWCRDWVSQYPDYALYQKHGLGTIVLKGGEPVAGASSYAGYCGGIEIEIDTREDHRRKGLARICGASLILKCLERGWYPSWDAQNKWSVALAEQLGYHFDCEYTAYEVTRLKQDAKDRP